MGITSQRLLDLKLVDRVVPEPLGGAHRDAGEMAASLSTALGEELASLTSLKPEELVRQRREKWRNYGEFQVDSAS